MALDPDVRFRPLGQMIVAPETSRTQRWDPVESSGPNQAQGRFWEKKQKQDLKDGQIGRFENGKKNETIRSRKSSSWLSKKQVPSDVNRDLIVSKFYKGLKVGSFPMKHRLETLGRP